MRIQIDPQKLKDSPLDGKSEELFTFDTSLIRGLAKDISYGNPTCYLVSGYRGAGKSSFLNKVELEIHRETVQNQQGDNEDSQKRIVFVHTSFAKYSGQTHLFRKLIRGLYQTFLKEENQDLLKELKDSELNSRKGAKPILLLETLYEKTFFETTTSANQKKEISKVLQFETDIILVIGLTLTFTVSLMNLLFDFLTIPIVINLIALLGSGIASIRKAVSLSHQVSHSETSYQEFERKSMYDNEIADYHFYSVLNSLSDKRVSVVFVLDELDKIEDTSVNDLIKEMKPYLVSGKASFIVVAGQKLSYKYHLSGTTDDSILSTLFSRVVHIPILKHKELSAFFDQLIIVNDNNEQDYKSAVDYLIFKSKCVPRKFISLIRQNISWDGKLAYFELPSNADAYSVYSTILKTLSNTVDNDISEQFSSSLRDYLTMQLYLKAERVLSMKSDIIFSEADIINYDGREQQ